MINNSTIVNCTGLFGVGLVDEADQLHCWNLSGHGELDVIGAIANSCNVFLCTTAYNLGLENGEFNQSLALEKIRQYAELFGLDEKTGIQITESAPQISDAMPLPSAIGQGTHAYTTSQLARYAATLYNNGTIYELNLLDRVTDSEEIRWRSSRRRSRIRCSWTTGSGGYPSGYAPDDPGQRRAGGSRH